MPRPLPLRRRMSTAARWPVGVVLTSWHYLWRTVPLHRTEEAGDPESDCPPALPAGVALDDVQRHEEGVGPLFHRRYRTRIRDVRLTAGELMERVAADPDCASPTEFASFVKLHGAPGAMRVGDEYRVRMAGPWDGPVRVVERTPTSFRLVTLDGHLEAGQIRFSTRQQDGVIVFEIESWARSAGPTVHLLYDRMRMAKEIQLHMWTSMLQRIAEVAGGRVTGGIDIHTRRVTEPVTSGVAERVAALRDRPLNFDPEGPHPESEGWRRDAYCEALPSEAPGPPVEGGAFQVAQTLLRDYRLADPSIVRVHYDHDAPLEGRNMLLELRVLLFRTYGGCRVGRMIDEERTVEGRPVRVWGWPYQTLEGHVEQGEMSWQVWKWLDTGEVQFRVHSYSRMVLSRNPLTTVGVWLFGQRQRHRYLTSACRRVREQTVEALRGEPSGVRCGGLERARSGRQAADPGTMTSMQRVGGAALLGAVCGMRTFMGPAALALRGRMNGAPTRVALTAAAAGEAIGDKTPLVPARTAAPSVAARVLSGALSGRQLAGAAGIAPGALGAVAATFGAYRARAGLTKLTGLPAPVLGLAEDAVAVAAAALATRDDREEAADNAGGAPLRAKRILYGAVRGAVAGVTATAAMTAAQLALQRATGSPPSRTPQRVSRKVLKRLVGRDVPRRRRDTLNEAAHWLYGTWWGVDLGVVAAVRGRRPSVIAGGAALGLAALAAAQLQLPAAGVAPPAWRQPPRAMVSDAGLHLLHGLAAAAVLRALP